MIQSLIVEEDQFIKNMVHNPISSIVPEVGQREQSRSRNEIIICVRHVCTIWMGRVFDTRLRNWKCITSSQLLMSGIVG